MERFRPKKHATLCMIIQNGKILLGMKKRGFGNGKYNGYGGKPNLGGSLESAALRELREESFLQAEISDLVNVGEIDFYFPHEPDFDQTVHIYRVLNFTGTPKETEEMSHHWFSLREIPYTNMWDDDKHWLPKVLEGKKVKGYIVFREVNQENIISENGLSVVDTL